MVRWRRPGPAGCDPVVPLLASALVGPMGTAHTPHLSILCYKNGETARLCLRGSGEECRGTGRLPTGLAWDTREWGGQGGQGDTRRPRLEPPPRASPRRQRHYAQVTSPVWGLSFHLALKCQGAGSDWLEPKDPPRSDHLPSPRRRRRYTAGLKACRDFYFEWKREKAHALQLPPPTNSWSQR